MPVHESWWRDVTTVRFWCADCGYEEEQKVVGDPEFDCLYERVAEHRLEYLGHRPELTFIPLGKMIPRSGNNHGLCA